jgi:hypothetical protein
MNRLPLSSNEVMKLAEQAERASEMLHGKVVARVIRHRPAEVILEFTDGTRFFVDSATEVLELSITGGK